MELAPVLLFTYNRLSQTKQTVQALQQNLLAPESELFIFSDGPRTTTEASRVAAVRDYLTTITGFKNVTIRSAEKNKGLANSIIDGVTQLINQYDQVIVLEDDLVTSRNFLSFCNQALQYYKSHPQVFSVGGYSRPIRGLDDKDVYFTTRATSWGWATWKDQWNQVDWSVKDYAAFSRDRTARQRFNQMGSDMATMLDKQMRGTISSWAIRWCYHQFRHQLVTVFPAKSKVSNIGFNEAASHTKGKLNSFATDLDETNNTEFSFPDSINLDKEIIKQFIKPWTISERIKNKVLNALPSL